MTLHPIPRTGTSTSTCSRRPRQRGLSLIELMVAIVITLFMVTAVMVVLLGMRNSFVAQGAMAHLQESERQAFTLLTASLRQAGYYTNPIGLTAAQALPALQRPPNGTIVASMTAGQPLFSSGNGGTGNNSDNIEVRYLTGTSDGVANCLGNTNPSTTSTLMVFDYWFISNNQLVCYDNQAGKYWVALVDNVNTMNITFGTDTRGTGNVDAYLSPDAVGTAQLWSKVHTVRISLTFLDPSKSTASNPQKLPYSITQVINLPNMP